MFQWSGYENEFLDSETNHQIFCFDFDLIQMIRKEKYIKYTVFALNYEYLI